ncbi:MAG: TrmH family RNA methyltransferase, partial [Desulfobacterales bacterium]|nr:TrmH family RNA methyltransferase [Desulfobacterales bacterium]
MNVKLDNVTIVLKGPKFPGNVGSAARCAMNMGIGKMMVVGNRDLDDEAVRQMATHVSREIVDGIRHFDTLDEALAGF